MSQRRPCPEMLLKHNLKTLRLPTMLASIAKLSREAADAGRGLRAVPAAAHASWKSPRAAPTRWQPGSRTPASRCSRIWRPTTSALMPSLSKQKVLELSRGQWIEEKTNACFIGNSRHRQNASVRGAGPGGVPGRQARASSSPPPALVNQLEEAQKQYRLERMLSALDKVDLLIVDELGYLSFSRGGAELLFQVFADRYERGSILITSNLPFGEWGQIFQGERMTAALLDRFTHRCHIFEMNGESYRFRESSKAGEGKEGRQMSR